MPEVAVPVEVALLGKGEYDLPVEANTWVEAELNFLVGQRREVVARWMDRGDYYGPFVQRVLREYGLPTDLLHLAMIESGFNPTARSRAGAVGMWQFMPTTGRSMGLRIDSVVDERMDPVRATYAAARHLRDLYGSFNSWPLAAAAYNAGSGRISRGLRGIGATNFWELAVWGDLAKETREYVPRLYAVTIIGRDRERFGLLSMGTPERFVYDSVRIDVPAPLAELARLGDVDPGLLTQYNPHLLQGATPPGGYWVWAPAGTGAALRKSIVETGIEQHGGLVRYTLRRGDDLAALSDRTGVDGDRLRALNPGVNLDRPTVGAVVVVPANVAERLKAPPAEPVLSAANANAPVAQPAAPRKAAVPPTAQPSAAKPEPAPPAPEPKTARAVPATRPGAAAPASATHTVAAGETLWAISRRYGVDVAALEQANDLRGAVIRPGQTLRIPGAVTSPAPREPARAEHIVRDGETLWGIAQKYGSTVEALQQANRLSDTTIRPGQTLAVPR